jgi:hypothetical protein
MSPSSFSTTPTSPTFTLDGNKEYNQGHSVERDWSLSLNEKGYEVQLESEDDPQQLSLCRRWLAVATISSAALCVTCGSSVASICNKYSHLGLLLKLIRRLPQAAFTIDAVSRQFHVGKEVAILGISIYVMGLGTGPLFSGPLSEVYGRNIVYRVSFVLFFALSFPVAFAPDIGKIARTSIGASAGL